MSLNNRLLFKEIRSLMQSCFRTNCSAETALLCVMNDLLVAADGGKSKSSVLVSLDLSATLWITISYWIVSKTDLASLVQF